MASVSWISPPLPRLVSVSASKTAGESDDERLAADERLRAQHRVAESEQLALSRVEVLHARALVLELFEQRFLPGLAQRLYELAVQIEVILDRRLARTGHEEDALHP